jgi:hypothetical protein
VLISPKSKTFPDNAEEVGLDSSVLVFCSHQSRSGPTFLTSSFPLAALGTIS